MDNHGKFNASFKPVFIAALIVLVVIVALFFVREVFVMNREIERLETTLFEEAKRELAIEVDNRKEEFAFSMDEAVQSITDTLDFGLERLSMFYDELDSMSIDETLIRSQLLFAGRLQSPIIDFEMMSADGEIVQSDGTLINLDDALLTVDQAILEAVMEESFEGGSVMVNNRKVHSAFIDLHNGDRIYAFVEHEALLAQEKAKTVSRFQEYYRNLSDTLFMVDGSGAVLLHMFEDYIGLNVNETDDDVFMDTYALINDVFENGENQNGAFIEYEFYESKERTRLTNRVAYVARCEMFDIIIGKSVPVSIYDDIMDEARASTRADFYVFVLPVYGILAIAITLLGVTLNRYVKQSSLTIKEEERLYKTIASRSNQVIVIADETGRSLYINETGKSVFNTTKDDRLFIEEKIADHGSRPVLVGAKQTYYVRLHKEKMMLNRRRATLYFFEDVSEEVESERTLRKAATVDLLTGLYNRRKLLDDFEQYFKPYVAQEKNGAFAIIDFDNFKSINDEHGHHYGDTVLTTIGKVFRAHSDDVIRFYRMGGDEFAVLAKLPKEQLMKRLHTVRDILRQTEFANGTPSFSYGIAQAEALGFSIDFSEYYATADKVLYKFKSSRQTTKNQ